MSLPLLLATLVSVQTADGASAPPPTDAPAATAPAASVPATSVPASTDVDPPSIEDIAAAAANPETAPVVTVMMSDRGSGIGDAAIVFRPPGGAWARAPLVGDAASASSSLFIARLPDGLQRTGFEYYVEARDKAGNGPAQIGSADSPIVVDKANEGTRVRLQREAIAQTAPEPVRIHPAFIMLGFGVGILSTSGAAGYLIDLSLSQRHLDDVQAELAQSGLSDDRRASLEKSKAGYEDAIVYDTAIAAVLGVVGVAGLITGTALLVVANFE